MLQIPRQIRSKSSRTKENIPINSLVYVSLGAGRHVNEICFSVLTAARFLQTDSDWRILVYTDNEEAFAGLPVDIRLVDKVTAEEWAGPKGYVYRAKILALADSLRVQQSSQSVMVDGDTYFKSSPVGLFGRLSPGTALMHVREGPPEPPEVAGLQRVIKSGQPVDLKGAAWDIEVNETMWNSGVVGLDAQDVELCDEALYLNDQLLDKGFGEHSHIAEMVAFGVSLSRRMRIRECFDVVLHYWPSEMRQSFGNQLDQAWSSPRSNAQRYETLWRKRPKESLERRSKFRVKRLAHRIGIDL